MEKLKVKIKKLSEYAVIPTYAKPGDMCMDVTAIDYSFDVKRECHVYKTGLAFEIPEGYGMLLFPRSSNRDTDCYLTNSVGVIDSGYRGEVLACYKDRDRENLNRSIPPFEIGERVAQVCILPYPIIEFIEVDELKTSERGEGGHGSTGK